MIRAYYVDLPLWEGELKEVAEWMNEPVKQVRIPYKTGKGVCQRGT